MNRRSFLKALVLGTAVAFPVAKLKVSGEPLYDLREAYYNNNWVGYEMPDGTYIHCWMQSESDIDHSNYAENFLNLVNG